MGVDPYQVANLVSYRFFESSLKILLLASLCLLRVVVWQNDPISGIVDVQFKAFEMNFSAIFQSIPAAILMDFFDNEGAAPSSD